VISPIIPRSRKGSAVAAAHNFALRGILDSGSQRKSCAGYEEREQRPSEKREGFFPEIPDGRGQIDGVLQTPDEIRGGKKNAESLSGFREFAQGNRCGRKEK